MIFFNVVVYSPIYVVLIWCYFRPKESLMWGKRWMVKEEPVIADEAIRNTKLACLIGIILTTLFLVYSILFLN